MCAPTARRCGELRAQEFLRYRRSLSQAVIGRPPRAPHPGGRAAVETAVGLFLEFCVPHRCLRPHGLIDGLRHPMTNPPTTSYLGEQIMKTITRMMIAGLVASVVFGSAAISNAQSPRSLFNQIARQARGHAQTLEIRNFGPGKSFQARHGFHGAKHWLPQPPNHCYPGVGWCPPPPPPVCHVFKVYYYDCHCGWKLYGIYHQYWSAQSAVQTLQYQGYRAYMKRVRR